jgi:2-polyprenyl-6-methoxyphenol hydroxylase-like FAD-dependent oxidoreductase
VISTEGIHSAIRRQFHPEEGDPVYSGVNMWRGVVVCKPFLSGATMTRVGWLSTGKMVIYPVRDNVDGKGSQLINWVAELETPDYKDKRDWNKPGRLEDFIGHFDDMAFNWLDIPDMIRRTESIFEFPMVDQDPLDRWTEGLVTLMGDAAHPMYPRGSNGAGQAIMDAKYLAEVLNLDSDPREVLKAYEVERLPATSKVVLTNRSTPPDAVLQVVFERTGDKPFDNIEDVVSRDELVAITSRYKQVAGYDLKQLKG